MASSTDTSPCEMQGRGRSDKTPVLAHRGRTTCKQEAFSALYAVLPWPCMHLGMTHQEPVSTQALWAVNRLSLFWTDQSGGDEPSPRVPLGLPEVYHLAIHVSSCYTSTGMNTKPTTMRLTPQDKQAIETIKELYGCPSDVAAIRLAIRMVARQEVRPSAQAPEKDSPFLPMFKDEGTPGSEC